jgi:hypothetical protein
MTQNFISSDTRNIIEIADQRTDNVIEQRRRGGTQTGNAAYC